MAGSLYIGALSGTSLDAIDIALFSIDTNNISLKASLSYPIPTVLRNICLKYTNNTACDLVELGSLDHQFGELFAQAILALLANTKITANSISAIGCHGQNLQHQPNLAQPFTMQIGDPNIIAARTGITTVADFRRKDLAVGGQGAPLAPGFHAAVFADPIVDRAIINIGGISNISVLPHTTNANAVLGFDIGPGNCLLDSWVQQYFNKPYDYNGELATLGTLIPELLTALLSDQYFSKIGPKSTGREYFNLDWLNVYLQRYSKQYSATDILTTLCALTSKTISAAINATTLVDPEIYICGGGAHNPILMAMLATDLGRAPKTTTLLGIDPDWVEAGLFAWLAQQRILGLPANIPTVTGASQAVVLGGIYI